MRQRVIAATMIASLSFGGALAAEPAPSAAPATTPAQAPGTSAAAGSTAAVPAQPEAPPAAPVVDRASERECRASEVTGSRLRQIRICRTRGEWARLDADAARAANRLLDPGRGSQPRS
jgi:hypothetical protein